ncbi:unnamed protein product [Musa hybrid cultivar]
MGELDDKPFLPACRQRFPRDDADFRAAMHCSKWQDELKNPDWHPFKIVTIDGNPQELIEEEDDEKLRSLKGGIGRRGAQSRDHSLARDE